MRRTIALFRNQTNTNSNLKVRVILTENQDPWLNLAIEEHIFRNFAADSPILFLWRNSPTVVIGKHQNPWKECRIAEMNADGIHLARRQSGGGAVYQDLGNTNFTFLSPRSLFDKEKNTEIITRAIGQFNITATASGRNDIIVGDRKISGSAYKLSADRAFHHGTLLINVDLGALGRYLSPSKQKLESKGVSSVTARVTNLAELDTRITHETLCETIVHEFKSHHEAECKIEHLNMEELLKDEWLKQYYEHLKDWEWRFGKTPKFTHLLETRFDWGTVDVHLDVVNGLIREATIFSDSLYPQLIEDITSTLKHVTYDVQAVSLALNTLKRQEQIHSTPMEQYVDDFLHWMVKNIS